MVFPQNAHLAVLVADRPAVQEQAELGSERDGDCDDGRQEESIDVRARMLCDFADGFDDDDDADGDHQRAETQIARGFNARLAAGEFPRIDLGDCAVAHDQREVGQRIEQRVGHGRKQRQRLGTDRRIQLQDGKNDVRREGSHDRDLVFQMVCIALFFGCTPVVVDRLQQALNVLVLRLVEFLEFARIPRLAVQRDGSAAVALARGVGANQGHFALGLDGGGEVIRVVVFGGRGALEVVAILAGAVGDITMGDGVVSAGCARGFDGGAVSPSGFF